VTPAPYLSDVAEGPASTRCVWVNARDGLRLRIALTPVEGATATVLIFPGRTEVVEKYGRIASMLAENGFASATLDWRGQGLSDRMLDDPLIGHVDRFIDYQQDVAAVVETAASALPGPFLLLAHSMGGCIGLRAVLEGLDVRAAAFSAPMWGIAMPALRAPFNLAGTILADSLGFGHLRAPSTARHSYILDTPFRENSLTSDPDDWAYMHRQVAAEPRFALAGPSLRWLREAIAECRWLARQSPRDLNIFTGLGSLESIVATDPIHARMANWPRGQLIEVEGARHELLMEAPGLRRQFVTPMLELFNRSLG